uniref:Uncharacterized protein n=1 Tax=Chromera velia CCMP2878 TaxID=1169474 RepID=A0A0G4F1A5_9ALVE|eukprot:Cvel_14564.t1-p1 / transcript=Cvel_14564.t1 / gene=Cvel_14564 / organism=Chromera_velia_CCMP2878 / gene_product=hypothetical protein / transcript_product=hypothetical protein / location=Cvel_scaffold1041:7517-7873(-) / protein_length=119 / sequence_SO=supercontig / SO=protein_coding / is_pseudo=false
MVGLAPPRPTADATPGVSSPGGELLRSVGLESKDLLEVASPVVGGGGGGHLGDLDVDGSSQQQGRLNVEDDGWPDLGEDDGGLGALEMDVAEDFAEDIARLREQEEVTRTGGASTVRVS